MSTVPLDQTDGGALSHVLHASERPIMTRSVNEVVAVLRETARAAAGAEGITVVIEDEGSCSYVAEDAVSPLWQGQTFQADHCISGWVMHHRQTVVIRDVRFDPRIPQDAYSPTLVRSLVMVPIAIRLHGMSLIVEKPATSTPCVTRGKWPALRLERVD